MRYVLPLAAVTLAENELPGFKGDEFGLFRTKYVDGGHAPP